ncbi:class F sortase [Streptomyces sp. NPDC060022]|uniref:class F sortase n=1 Tax=Streptomyces sp. NPDC060022 TaxID=3347039 RepID=UPI0036988B02
MHTHHGRRSTRSAGHRLTAAAFAVLVLGALTACGADDGSRADTPPARISTTAPSATVSSPPAAAVPAEPMAASEPVRVRVPSADVDTGPVLKLGLAADGTVEVPSVGQADRIGWYTKGVTPGELGPAVLIGHFDTAKGPAVLKNVSRIRAGDRITVSRADGSEAVFAVRALEQVDKDSFPTDKVYGETTRPELRLITCGGELENGHRPDNIIVYADLVQ